MFRIRTQHGAASGDRTQDLDSVSDALPLRDRDPLEKTCFFDLQSVRLWFTFMFSNYTQSTYRANVPKGIWSY